MLGLHIERNSKLPLSRQLYDQLRNSMFSGNLKAGLKLPPSRQLAESLGISRNVIMEVYDQLLSEGFLLSRAGSGTYVADGIHIRTNEPVPEWNVQRKNTQNQKTDVIDFVSGIPDLRLFPAKAWERSLREAYEAGHEALFGYGSISGDPELREAISAYLFASRGIRCSPENVLITAGASQGLMLVARAFASSFTEIYMEEPSVDFIRDIFISSGYQLKPVQVDEEGILTDTLTMDNDKTLVFLTPSFQFPTGHVLSIQRRQALVEWVQRTDSIIIEDGYDSEFRYKGMLTPPLLSMDYEHTIYIGTFSKNLSPGLRLGYLIVPSRFKPIVKKIRNKLNLYVSQVDQKILAKFIANGYLERHIYEMKKVYRKKQYTLIQTLKSYFGHNLSISSNDAGMHLIVVLSQLSLKSSIDWNQAEAYGLRVYPIADYYYGSCNKNNTLILGYGNLSLEEIKTGVMRLHSFLSQYD